MEKKVAVEVARRVIHVVSTTAERAAAGIPPQPQNREAADQARVRAIRLLACLIAGQSEMWTPQDATALDALHGDGSTFIGDAIRQM